MSLRSRRSICDRQSVYVDGRAGQTHAFTLLKPTLAYRLNMSLCFLRSAIALSLLPWAAVQPALAWGVEGHRIINRLAGTHLPPDVPAFLRSERALEALSYYAPLPDHWRGVGEPALTKASAPEHYIQMESLGLIGSLPKNRYDYVRAMAVAQAANPKLVLTAEKIGMQPYQAVELWERLKVGMRDYRELLAAKQDTKPVEAEVIFLAGWLGHYVGDASMPLHTSDKPNGWIGPNPGEYTTEHHIHGLFESEFVRMNITLGDVEPQIGKAPVLLGDMFDQYLAYLNRSHALVERTYQLEKAGAFTEAGTVDGKVFATGQLGAAATELRDMIYTAWLRSGEPVPRRQ